MAAFRWAEVDAGTVVSDPAGWWRDPRLLPLLAEALADPFRGSGVTVVVGPESRGFLLGGLVARELGAGFVEAYKYATPGPGVLAEGPLAVRARLLSTADRVLAVDDWVETGTQLAAVAAIVARAGATFVGASVIMDARRDRSAVPPVRALLSASDLSDGVRPAAELPPQVP